MAITKAGVDRGVSGRKETATGGAQMTPEREHKIDRFEKQNPMYDCGYAKEIDARQRAFGVLGFPTEPEAAWGGTPLHKESEEEAERRGN